MVDRLAIFRCPSCPGSTREYDLPALTEHIAKTHLEGFHVFTCPGCGEKFATSYRACHHMVTCDAEALTSESSKALHDLDLIKHMELQRIVNKSIRDKFDELGNRGRSDPGTPRQLAETGVNTDICMPDDLMDTFISEPYSPPLHIVIDEEEEEEEQESDEEEESNNTRSTVLIDEWSPRTPESAPRSPDPASPTAMDIEDPEPRSIPCEGLVAVKAEPDEYVLPKVEIEEKRPRKRRFDVADPQHPELGTAGFEHPSIGSPRLITIHVGRRTRVGLLGDAPAMLPTPETSSEYQQIPVRKGSVKEAELMSHPQHDNSFGATNNNVHNSYGHPNSHFTHDYHSRHPTTPMDRRNAPKLVGHMPLRNMDMFDERTASTDVIVEIEGIKGIHQMYFESKFLQEHSEYFKKVLTATEFKELAEKKLSLHCSLASFIDCMHVLHNKPLPWKMRCHGYFCIPNIHRIFRMLNCAQQFNFNAVVEFVAHELFSIRCGPECIGCIDRVAIALHFGIPIPEGVVFSPLAALTWLQDCDMFSCAPEMQATAAVSHYLKTFINGLI